MSCGNCGADLSTGAGFCNKCGAPVGDAAQPYGRSAHCGVGLTESFIQDSALRRKAVS